MLTWILLPNNLASPRTKIKQWWYGWVGIPRGANNNETSETFALHGASQQTMREFARGDVHWEMEYNVLAVLFYIKIWIVKWFIGHCDLLSMLRLPGGGHIFALIKNKLFLNLKLKTIIILYTQMASDLLAWDYADHTHIDCFWSVLTMASHYLMIAWDRMCKQTRRNCIIVNQKCVCPSALKKTP